MKKLVVFLFFLGIIVFFSITLVTRFRVKNVFCETMYGPCSKDLEGRLSSVENGRFLSGYGQVKEILKSDSTVLEHKINFVFPNSLRVYAAVRKPFIAVTTDKNRYLYVDNEGVVVAEVFVSQLPHLLITDPVFADNLEKEKLQFLSELLFGINSEYGIKFAEVSDLAFRVEIENKTVYLPLQGNAQEYLKQLQLVVSQLKARGQETTIEEIDLRFKNPVIR